MKGWPMSLRMRSDDETGLRPLIDGRSKWHSSHIADTQRSAATNHANFRSFRDDPPRPSDPTHPSLMLMFQSAAERRYAEAREMLLRLIDSRT